MVENVESHTLGFGSLLFGLCDLFIAIGVVLLVFSVRVCPVGLDRIRHSQTGL